MSIRSQLNTHLDVCYIIVKGGCDIDNCIKVDNIVYIDIVENLSDNNVFVGFQRNVIDFFCEEVFINATYVVLHDTCVISHQFYECMKALLDLNFTKKSQWIFAHTFGLYNIGVCTYEFVLQRAIDFENIALLPKKEGISLEQGNSIKLNNKIIPSLLDYSKYTLANMINYTSFNKGVYHVDTYGINGICEDGSTRWVAYISSLGVHKMIGSNMSYFVPIWHSQDHHPNDINKFRELKEFGTNYMTSFIPLIPFKNI
jgi:hypothetical protein